MVVERDGGLINRTVVPDVVEDKCMMVSYGRLGVRSMGGEINSLDLTAAVSAAAVDSFDMAITMLRGIGRLASGNANQGEIGGPIKIAEISGRVASQGFMSLMMFVAIISINLGLVNLLPIPSLDGGHLMFFGLEAVMGKPISPAIQDLIMRGGMALLLTLIVFVTFFDISSLFMAEC
jgi:regulator of sigma E protease